MRIQKGGCPLPDFSEKHEPRRTSEEPKGLWSSPWCCHMLLSKAGLQVCLTSCHFTDCFCLRNPSRSCQGHVDSFLSIQAKLLISNFLTDSHFLKLLLVKHQIKRLLPASTLPGVAFPSAWGTVLGVSLPRWGMSSYFFAKLGAWWELAKPVQESLCHLTILSSYCKFISVICNLLVPNQLLFLNFGGNCCSWSWKSLPWEKRKGTIIILQFLFTAGHFFWLLLLNSWLSEFWTYAEKASSLQVWGRLNRGPYCLYHCQCFQEEHQIVSFVLLVWVVVVVRLFFSDSNIF